MDLVFKITAISPSDPAQVGDTNFQEHYSGVNTSMAWSELLPAIRQATEKFVFPYVGDELYNDLAAKYQAGDTLSDEQAKTLELLQDAIAFYTIYHILPEKNSVVASMGVIQNTPTEGSGQPVSQWGWKAKRWSALENGDTFLDRLLNYLEAQVTASVAYFDLWKDSTAYNVKVSDFFRHTDELDEYLNIQGSRRSFISLIKFMRDTEEGVILPLLCTDQYDALKASGLDDTQKALLRKVRLVVANLGLAEAGAHHRLVIDGDGFRVVSQTDQFDDRRNQTNNIHENAILALLQAAERKGRTALDTLKVFLEKNETDYPLWANSDCREKGTTKGHGIVVSSDCVGGIGLF